MKTYLTLSAIALAAAASLSSGVASAADAAPVPAFTLSYNLGVTSDYRVRGIKQNGDNPAAQGGVDLAHSSGFYVGIWGSNVSDWTAAGSASNLEVDYYGGYKTEVAGVAVDAGTIYYKYPSTATPNLSNTHEAYLGLTYGPATFKTSYVLSNNYFASTALGKDASGTVYYDLTLSQEVFPKLTAAVHAGYTDYKESASGYTSGKFSYADYNLGLTYDLDGYLLGVKYYINDAKAGTKEYGFAEGKSLVKNGVAFSVLKSF